MSTLFFLQKNTDVDLIGHNRQARAYFFSKKERADAEVFEPTKLSVVWLQKPQPLASIPGAKTRDVHVPCFPIPTGHRSLPTPAATRVSCAP